MTKMKTAVIAATLVALGLGLSGAYAQNANDRPGMTAPQEGTMTQPNQPGSMSNPQRAPQTTGAHPGNTKSMNEQAGGKPSRGAQPQRRAHRFKDKSVAPIMVSGRKRRIINRQPRSCVAFFASTYSCAH